MHPRHPHVTDHDQPGRAPGARSIQALKVFLSRTAMKCALKTPRRLPGLDLPRNTGRVASSGHARPRAARRGMPAGCQPAANRSNRTRARDPDKVGTGSRARCRRLKTHTFTIISRSSARSEEPFHSAHKSHFDYSATLDHLTTQDVRFITFARSGGLHA
jgi:hypothetical protein